MLPWHTKKVALIALYCAAVVAFLVVVATNLPLMTREAPWGIVSLAMAITPGAAHEIMAAWNPQAIWWARIGLVCDFVNLILYAIALGHFSSFLGRKLAWRSPWFRTVGHAAAGLMAVAAACDCIENLGLWVHLQGHVTSQSIATVWWCSFTKFGLGAVVLAWLFAGFAIAWREGRSPEMAMRCNSRR